MGQNYSSSYKRLCNNQNSPPNNQKLPSEALGYSNNYSTSTMFQLIPDELLLEILTRLPNARSVFQCTAVCKRWSSLISHHRQYLLSSTTTILFRFSRDQRQPFHQLFPNRSSVETLILDFLPHNWPNNVVIRASCEDLLLVSQGTTGLNYLLCNPLTKHWTVLPQLLSPGPKNEFKLPGPSDDNDNINRKESFTVVIFHHMYISIYRSGARQWAYTCHPRIRIFESLYTKPAFDIVTTSSGAMHWLDGSRHKFSGVVGYNPGTNKCQIIQFPCGKRTIARTNRPSKDTICLGVVKGRLRLSRIVKVNKACTCLKIWERETEVDEQKSSWALIHKVTLKKAAHICFVLAMHPSHENTVFVVCDREILTLDLQNNVYKMVGEFPCQGEALSDVKEKVALYMKVFPLLHSLFPTSLH